MKNETRTHGAARVNHKRLAFEMMIDFFGAFGPVGAHWHLPFIKSAETAADAQTADASG
jgi:hypothetical protein